MTTCKGHDSQVENHPCRELPTHSCYLLSGKYLWAWIYIPENKDPFWSWINQDFSFLEVCEIYPDVSGTYCFERQVIHELFFSSLRRVAPLSPKLHVECEISKPPTVHWLPPTLSHSMPLLPNVFKHSCYIEGCFSLVLGALLPDPRQ